MSKTKTNPVFKTELFGIQKPISKFLKQNAVSVLTAQPGCGKDFICMYTAIELFTQREVDKIIITKPIVEVGRSIGFLPGSSEEKIEPYRKSFDNIVDKIIGKQDSKRVQAVKKAIKFEPLNYVRGNTFENAVIILSEAQNCTLHELISFITRLDKTSKMFLNGDIMQSDIGNSSGLRNLLTIIDNVEGLEHKQLGDEFQTRHPMIVKLNKEYIKFLKK